MSAGRIYSERFLIARGDGVWTSYTVPMGYRAVVRSIVAANPGETTQLFYVQIANTTVVFGRFQVATTTVVYDVRLVAYQGEVVRALTYGTTEAVVVAGYLFEDPLGARAPAVDRELAVNAEPLPAET